MICNLIVAGCVGFGVHGLFNAVRVRDRYSAQRWAAYSLLCWVFLALLIYREGG